MLGRGDERLIVVGIAAVATLLLGTLTFVGADLATMFQYAVMGALVLALASFFWGMWETASLRTLQASWERDARPSSFWVLFANFSPPLRASHKA
jgi:hypothetical protein